METTPVGKPLLESVIRQLTYWNISVVTHAAPALKTAVSSQSKSAGMEKASLLNLTKDPWWTEIVFSMQIRSFPSLLLYCSGSAQACTRTLKFWGNTLWVLRRWSSETNCGGVRKATQENDTSVLLLLKHVLWHNYLVWVNFHPSARERYSVPVTGGNGAEDCLQSAWRNWQLKLDSSSWYFTANKHLKLSDMTAYHCFKGVTCVVCHTPAACIF